MTSKSSRNSKQFNKVESFFRSLDKKKSIVYWKDEFNAGKGNLNDKGGVAGNAIIPPRPFIKQGIENGLQRAKVEYVKSVKDGFKKLDTKIPRQGLFEAGNALAGGIKESIDGLFEPELSPMTINIRRSNGNDSTKPLIDTGEMRDSLRVSVVDKSFLQQ